MGEEEAFHTLARICEVIVPDYYSSKMKGIRIDQRVVEMFIELFLPNIHNHFRTIMMPGMLLISFEWFMCFFVRCLPLDVSFKIQLVCNRPY